MAPARDAPPIAGAAWRTLGWLLAAIVAVWSLHNALLLGWEARTFRRPRASRCGWG